MHTVLFDLDATLLPMDQTLFVRAYLQKLEGALGGLCGEAGALRAALYKGLWAMLQNDGRMTNEACFFAAFTEASGLSAKAVKAVMETFYERDFEAIDGIFPPDPLAARCVRTLRQKGYGTVLATNPLFPKAATFKRIAWAGLAPGDFDHITTYENSSYCKPNLKYYEEILQRINRRPADCLMVGNDVAEDMCAEQLGMAVFLVDTYLINESRADLSCYPRGNMAQLWAYIQNLPRAESVENRV